MIKNTANIIPKIRLYRLKRLLSICIVFIIVYSNSFIAKSQNAGRITTIVIDAGHGGKDPGASGKKSLEKDIALKVALKTGKYIEQNIPGVKVIYTRKTDHFVELHKRGKIANEADADLFISIHCNSNPSTSPYGSETYALGVEEKRTKRNMEVAMTENAAIMLEDHQDDLYDGFDINSPESYIGLTLFQSEHLDQSLDLAHRIQGQFKNRAGRRDRGVHQAGFLVLWRTAMPSVLVELGYLSNATEESFLITDEGQSYMASAIYRAVKEYKREYEKENGVYDYRKEALEDYQAKPNVDTETKKESAEEATTKPKPNNSLIYRVQFYTSPKKLPLNDTRFKSLSDMIMYEHNGVFKYTTGAFPSLEQAENHKKAIRSKGFSDAFTVIFYKGVRISSARAKELLNEK